MKRIIISSIAVLGIIGGGLFIMDNNIEETINPQVDYRYVGDTPNISTTPTTMTITNTLPEADTESDVTQPIENTEIDYNQIYIDSMLENFLTRGSIYRFINERLKKQYPEKFIGENLQPTMDYLINHFSNPENYTDEAMQANYINFAW